MTASQEQRPDMLIGLMAAQLGDGEVVATGVASPLAILAIAVARATHAPTLRYLACVGSLDPDLGTLHRTPEDLRYLDGRCAEVQIPELFDHARRGRIHTVFFGAAQVDGRGDTNMSAIGPLSQPKVKLPGLAGASSLRRWSKRPILVVPKHSRRSLVDKVGVASTSDAARPTRLLTDLGVFELGDGGALLVQHHAWTSVEDIAERTGFPFAVSPDLFVTPPPSAATVDAIRRIDSHELRFGLVA